MSSMREFAQGCKNEVYASFHRTTNKEVEQISALVGLKLNRLPYLYHVPLCKHHYHLVKN